MAVARADDPLHGPERRRATQAEAKALGSAVRLRILRLCLDDQLTNREIAEGMGLNPATCLHHVRTLVDTGFLEPLPARRGKRGAREIPYRATGKSWHIDGAGATTPLLEASLAELEASPIERRKMIRMGLKLPEEQIAELEERMIALVEEFRARPADSDAESWGLLVALHPSGRRGG